MQSLPNQPVLTEEDERSHTVELLFYTIPSTFVYPGIPYLLPKSSQGSTKAIKSNSQNMLQTIIKATSVFIGELLTS